MSKTFWYVFAGTIAVLVVGYFALGVSINVFEGSAWRAVPKTPAAPSNLSASVVPGTASPTVSLRWFDNAINESRFDIYRAVSTPSAMTWVKIATLPVNSSVYTDGASSPLSLGQSYSYQVRACNVYGCSSPSNTATVKFGVVSGIPSAPSNLVAQPQSSSTIVLNWKDNSTNETWFDVAAGTRGFSIWDSTWSLPAGTTSFTHRGLRPGVTYYYGVRARNSSGASESILASATTLAPLACSPLSQSVGVGQAAILTASGAGIGTSGYSWSAPDGSPSSGFGSQFSTSYFTPGVKTVTVSASNGVGGMNLKNCTVDVIGGFIDGGGSGDGGFGGQEPITL